MIKTKNLFEILGVAVVGTATFFSLIAGSSEPARAESCTRNFLGYQICVPTFGTGSNSGSLVQQTDTPPPPPPTILNYCNNTSSTIYFAHAYASGNQGWMSKGWWTVLPQNCVDVDIGLYNGNVYVYGFNESNGEYRGSDASFCIRSNKAFSFANADTRNCSGNYLKRVGMNQWGVLSGGNRYNFN